MLTRGSGRRVALTLATLITVGMLTACSGDEEVPAAWPTMAQPTATALSPTPTPTPDPRPSLPPAAKEGTPAGAEEFVRYFLRVYEYMYATNDAEQLVDVTLKGCRFCQGLLDDIRQQRTAEQRLVGYRMTVLSIAAAPNATQDRAVVHAAFAETASKQVDKLGRVVDTWDATEQQTLLIALRWDLLHGWRILAGQFEDGDK